MPIKAIMHEIKEKILFCGMARNFAESQRLNTDVYETTTAKVHTTFV